jgi:hypothetical protein
VLPGRVNTGLAGSSSNLKCCDADSRHSPFLLITSRLNKSIRIFVDVEETGTLMKLPAVIVYDNREIKLLSRNGDVHPDVDYSPCIYSEHDFAINSDGIWYRLCYRDSKQYFHDKLGRSSVRPDPDFVPEPDLLDKCKNRTQASDQKALDQLGENLNKYSRNAKWLSGRK